MSIRILLVRADGAWGIGTEDYLRSSQLANQKPQVVVVDSGEEAVDQVQSNPFDLAMADLVLPRPGMSGAHALARIRELSPNCHAILVSDHDYVEALVGEVADAFIVRSSHPKTAILGRQLLGIANELLGPRPAVLASPPLAEADSQQLTLVESIPPPISSDLTPLGPETPALPQRMIAGKYRLGSRIGRGGMGEVFRAEDTFIQRTVAVKLLRVESSSQVNELRRRMHREVMIAGSLTHPNIVTVHDAGFDGIDMYLVMALVNGQNLKDFLADRGALPPEKAVGIAVQILAGLDHAHEKDIVHRDLKPANVLMEKDGTVKVADFGLAKIRSMATRKEDSPPSAAFADMTAAGAVLGTLAYMAPEQMLGQNSDPRSDLYTLGAILFEMLHGRPLARLISTQKRAAYLHMGRSAPDLPSLPDLPAHDRLLQRALALQPAERFQSSASMASALRELGIR